MEGCAIDGEIGVVWEDGVFLKLGLMAGGNFRFNAFGGGNHGGDVSVYVDLLLCVGGDSGEFMGDGGGEIWEDAIFDLRLKLDGVGKTEGDPERDFWF